jgi:hypothetical protein
MGVWGYPGEVYSRFGAKRISPQRTRRAQRKVKGKKEKNKGRHARGEKSLRTWSAPEVARGLTLGEK